MGDRQPEIILIDRQLFKLTDSYNLLARMGVE